MIDLNLKGKKAVVTGASLGIGAATVRLLADHGADVTFCARSQKGVKGLSKYKTKGSGSVKGLIADMGEEVSTNEFIESVQSVGPTDILINNVGASPSRNFLYMTDDI